MQAISASATAGQVSVKFDDGSEKRFTTLPPYTEPSDAIHVSDDLPNFEETPETDLAGIWQDTHSGRRLVPHQLLDSARSRFPSPSELAESGAYDRHSADAIMGTDEPDRAAVADTYLIVSRIESVNIDQHGHLERRCGIVGEDGRIVLRPLRHRDGYIVPRHPRVADSALPVCGESDGYVMPEPVNQPTTPFRIAVADGLPWREPAADSRIAQLFGAMVDFASEYGRRVAERSQGDESPAAMERQAAMTRYRRIRQYLGS